MDKQTFSLEGKVALITGASRGIGKAISIGYAEAGADVFLASRKLQDLEIVASEIRTFGRCSKAISANMVKSEDISNLVEQVIQQSGKIDILVNNAGGAPGTTSLINLEPRFWESVIALNLQGPVFLSQAVAKTMRERGGGSIINITSIDAFKPDPICPPYSISKAGLTMATKSMALEWAKYHIRVNALAPGNVHTRFGDSRSMVIPDFESETIAKTPLNRFADPEDIVGAAVYLASDAAKFVTGTTIIVDGGLLLM